MANDRRRLATLHAEMTAWRRHLHAHPETAFEEHDTAAFVAERLASFGHRRSSRPRRHRRRRHAQRSATARRSACAPTWTRCRFAGGRTTSPTARRAPARCTPAATTAIPRCCSAPPAIWPRRGAFRGTVHFIFQPAEENEAGGRVMVEDGLFARFPVDAVYGLHNWPGLPVGRIALRTGPMMAACDLFEIDVSGRGCHAAMPHLGTDAVLAAAAIVGGAAYAGRPHASIRTMPRCCRSRRCMRATPGTCFRERALLRGTVRAFRAGGAGRAGSGDSRAPRAAVAAAHRCTADVRYERRYPATVNDAEATGRAARAAALARRRGQRRAATRPEHGLRGLRLHAARAARLLRLARQRPDRGRLRAAQPALRLQRRDPADRRRLLGDAGRDANLRRLTAIARITAFTRRHCHARQ